MAAEGLKKGSRRRSPINGRKRAKFCEHYSIYIFFRRNWVFYRHISVHFPDFSAFSPAPPHSRATASR
jgi:hypothetical protein